MLKKLDKNLALWQEFLTVKIRNVKELEIMRFYNSSLPITLFLIWIFFGRNLNNWINHLHERSLRISYNDYESSSFQELLELDNSVSIHHRNIPLLANELFKVKNGLSNKIMSELFDLRIIECKLRSQTNFSFGAVYTTKYGLTTLRCFAPKIWNITPRDIINVNNGLGLYMSIRIYKLIDVSDRQVFRFFFWKNLAFLLICWWMELKYVLMLCLYITE